ncbi:hypothetical protein GCM10027615_30190 [Plantactinospora veratri]
MTEFGRRVTSGRPRVTFEVTTVEPAKATWVAVPSAASPTTSVRMPLSSLTASRAAISFLLAGGEQHGGRLYPADQLGQYGRLRRHQVAVDLLVLGRVDLLRAVLAQPVAERGGGAGSAEHHRCRRTQFAGEGEQFERDLLDAELAGRLDDDENLGHDFSS